MKNWKSIGIVVEGQPMIISGLNVWDYKWTSLKEPAVKLPHPDYPAQLHSMNIYEIINGEQKVKFAAGELSANVYGFYVPAMGASPTKLN